MAEDMKHLLELVADRANRYLSRLDQRPISPDAAALAQLEQLGGALPDEPTPADQVIALLDDVGSPATVITTGGRYFGFVIGGALPASLAANWLAGAWDQCAGIQVLSPAAAELERVAAGWLLELLGLPADTAVGFVTGATSANLTCLAAARHVLLERAGWNVEEDGLLGAPPIDVIVGDEVHVSVLKALSLLGLGRNRVRRVPVDDQGRMQAEALPSLAGPTLICLQAGNVNTGAFDPAEPICAAARKANAWVHVDGAFGLWAAAAPARAHLVRGVGQADSWATDAHKWLNVPYDSGIAFVRDRRSVLAAMTVDASYLMQETQRDPYAYTPQMSRRARGVEVWAALRSLGRQGVADLVERTCRHAERFAHGFREAGYRVLNDVVINQVLVSFGDAERTQRVIDRVQQRGVCWCSGTVWQGHTAMRLSVSSWATTGQDVERSLNEILEVAAIEKMRSV
jgi:glutamate/tyrosine decarboxylase-like PLP-dependent enzyme